MAITVQNLTKFYGHEKTIDNILFEVKTGEILGFLGPNGAGKTTTLKIIEYFIMKKNIIISSILFLILLALAYYMTHRPGETSWSQDEKNSLFKVDSASIDRIEVISPQHNFVFVKQNQEWYLQEPINYKADQSVVGSLIEQIGSARATATISSNPEKQTIFQVDSTGTKVILSSKGNELANLIIGKMGTTYTETYVRRSSSNDVVLVDAYLTAITTRQLKDWRDRTIVKVPRELIQEIKYQYGDTTFVVSMKDSLWHVDQAKADEFTIRTIVTSLSDLKGNDVIDEEFSKLPKVQAMVTYNNIQLWFVKRNDKDVYYVKSSEKRNWFELSSLQTNQILKRKKELVKSGV